MSENTFSRGVLLLNHACFFLGYKEEFGYREGSICLVYNPPASASPRGPVNQSLLLIIPSSGVYYHTGAKLRSQKHR